ncbi:MAG: 6-carboxytetrahydropterin synthase QueD [Chloroflexi bacterium]|nr:6-carboxytetrahydropterin synthase QueD [Chloroflexota bacterium]
MYEVSVRVHFDAAHYLRGYQGKCENTHGHRFQIVLTVRADKLDEIGIAFDFTQLKELARSRVLARYDHVLLNEVEPFTNLNPSSENIAATIFANMEPELARLGVRLQSVQCWETPEQYAAYVPNEGR